MKDLEIHTLRASVTALRWSSLLVLVGLSAWASSSIGLRDPVIRGRPTGDGPTMASLLRPLVFHFLFCDLDVLGLCRLVSHFLYFCEHNTNTFSASFLNLVQGLGMWERAGLGRGWSLIFLAHGSEENCIDCSLNFSGVRERTRCTAWSTPGSRTMPSRSLGGTWRRRPLRQCLSAGGGRIGATRPD